MYSKEIIIVVGKDLCTHTFPEALFITMENGSNLNKKSYVTRLLKHQAPYTTRGPSHHGSLCLTDGTARLCHLPKVTHLKQWQLGFTPRSV